MSDSSPDRFWLGIAAGVVWNVASLWCLSQMLGAWLGPRRSTRRALGWLLVKFPLLYAVIVLVFLKRAVSVVGFGIGFTVVLCGAVVAMASQARRMGRAHGS